MVNNVPLRLGFVFVLASVSGVSHAQRVVYPSAPANAQTTPAKPADAPAASSQGMITPMLPSNDPADRLAANLVILSQRPRDVDALIGAGLSAIAIGDGNAALGFLARAEELSPANGRIKAALGSALLLVERPNEALKLFSEATSHGVPDAHFARDRGLAYDLRGDTKLAQRDYAIAMRADNDDELRRRYALSLGISGDRNKALELLDPLIAKGDKAAWRARAFVLAMNGNIAEAETIVASTMPGGMQAPMASFLRRLGGLNPAERALAVNYGTLVNDGSQMAAVQMGDPYRPGVGSGIGNSGGGASAGLIPAGDPLGPQVTTSSQVATVSTSTKREPRRRPGDRIALSSRGVALVPGVDPVNPTPMAQKAAALAQTASEVRTSEAGIGEARASERLGKRIGPVDPRALPLEARGVGGTANTAADGAQRPAGAAPPRDTMMATQTIITQMSSLPPPTRRGANENRALGVSAPSSLATTDTAAPVFEIPSATTSVKTDAVKTPVLLAANEAPSGRIVPVANGTPVGSLAAPSTMPASDFAEVPAMSVAQAATVTQTAPPSVNVRSATASATATVPATVPVTTPATMPVTAAQAAAVAPLTVPSTAPGATIAGPPAAPPSFATIFVPPSSVIPDGPAIAPAPGFAAVGSVASQVPANAAITSSQAGDGLAAQTPTQAQTGVAIDAPVIVAQSAGLGAIIASIDPEEESAAAPLPTDAELRKLRFATQRKTAAATLAAKEAAAAELAEKERKEAERADAAKHPPRVWVQVADGANKAGLPVTWRKLRSANPALFKGLAAWVTPRNRATRLLVGPFKGNSEARELVSKMGKAGLSGFTFASAKGQDVERLAAK